MTRSLKLINTEAPNYSLVMTEISKDIIRTLDHVRGLPTAITMIAGVPGAGKSETIRRYAQHHCKKMVQHTAVAGEGKIWDLARALMEQLEIGEPNSRRLSDSRYEIAAFIGADGNTLIIDESQNLAHKNPRSGVNLETFEWCRAMTEEGGFSLVFVGDLKLLNIVSELPQLQRRLRRPVIIRSVSRADVAAIAGTEGVVDEACIDALHGVSRTHGALGDVVNVCRHAKAFSGNRGVSAAHLLAAIEDLKLTPGARR